MSAQRATLVSGGRQPSVGQPLSALRVLDLCSGTGSLDRWAAAQQAEGRSIEVTSVDICGALGHVPTHKADLLAWDYAGAGYPVGHFDVVWASPPCTMYSCCRTTARTPRDLEGADRLVARCMEIIEHFRPRAWVLENPQTGLLKTRDVVRGLPYVDIDYCQFGMDYRKRTRFWSNLAVEGAAPVESRLCDKATCHAVDASGKHRVHLGGDLTRQLPVKNRWINGKIPPGVYDHLFAPLLLQSSMRPVLGL